MGGTPYNHLGVANQVATFGRLPIDNCSHNNQPKTGVHDGGEYREDVHRSGGTGEARYHYFESIRSGEANENSNKSLSLEIIFILDHTIKQY